MLRTGGTRQAIDNLVAMNSRKVVAELASSREDGTAFPYRSETGSNERWIWGELADQWRCGRQEGLASVMEWSMSYFLPATVIFGSCIWV